MGEVAEHVGLAVEISPDRIQAFLITPSDMDGSLVTEAEVCRLLTQSRIPVTDSVKQRVSEFVRLFRAGKAAAEPFLVAAGTAPEPPIHQSIRWAGPYAPDQEETSSLYDRQRVVTAVADTILGTLQPGQDGRDGVDVFGHPVRSRGCSEPLRLGSYVALDSDGQTVRATGSGQIVCRNGKLSINPILDIPGDVDFGTGNVNSEVSVLVHGTVRDLFIVRSKADITVRGMVTEAYLSAGGDVVIGGGVEGRQKGWIEAAGAVSVKFLNFVHLEAGADVEVANEAIDSAIICGGRLLIPNGSLIGGQAFAVQGAEIKSVGSPAGVRTALALGFHPVTLRRIFAIEQNIRKEKELVAKIRTSVAPLLTNLKRLTADQREKATELMCKAEELEAGIGREEQERKELLATFPPVEQVELLVCGRILPNTQIMIGNRCITVTEEVKGPVKIVLRPVDGKKELLLLNTISGSSRTLMAGKLNIETFVVPERPAIAQPGRKPEAQSNN